MNTKIILTLLATLFCSFAAQATYVPGLSVSAGYDIIITSGSCPTGFTEDTAMRGFYAVGNTATGTVGNSLGTAMTGTTIPDTTYTPAGTNGTSTVTVSGGNNATSGANTVTALTSGNSGTAAAQTFTGTAATTMRSLTAPGKQIMFCKKT